MKFLGELEKITETKYSVGFIHYMPFDSKHGFGKTQAELEQEGILVASIPEPQQIKGKQAILYCNPSTKELWYEYEDIPITEETKIAELEKQVNALNIAMAEIMGV